MSASKDFESLRKTAERQAKIDATLRRAGTPDQANAENESSVVERGPLRDGTRERRRKAG